MLTNGAKPNVTVSHLIMIDRQTPAGGNNQIVGIPHTSSCPEFIGLLLDAPALSQWVAPIVLKFVSGPATNLDSHGRMPHPFVEILIFRDNA
jgi:hypothetical protein